MPGTRRLLFPVLLILSAACASDEGYDIVLQGGRVMDPATGVDSMLNVAISGDSIAAISAEPLRGATIVDVSGLVVAPGFIDLHAHGQTTSDMHLQVRDGVTTALEMEIGVYPVARWYASMEGSAPINYGATVSHPGVMLACNRISRDAIACPGITTSAVRTGRQRGTSGGPGNGAAGADRR